MPALASDDDIHDFCYVQIGKHDDLHVGFLDVWLRKKNVTTAMPVVLSTAVLALAVCQAACHVLDGLLEYAP